MRWLLVLLLMPGFAFAQTPAEKKATVEKLLRALQDVPTSEAAAPLEQSLQQLWIDGGTAAVTLLMHRGLRELKAGTLDEAVQSFGDAIVLDPGLAEAAVGLVVHGPRQ